MDLGRRRGVSDEADMQRRALLPLLQQLLLRRCSVFCSSHSLPACRHTLRESKMTNIVRIHAGNSSCC